MSNTDIIRVPPDHRLVPDALALLHSVDMGARFDSANDLRAWLDQPDRAAWAITDRDGTVAAAGLAHHLDADLAGELRRRWAPVAPNAIHVGDGYVTALATRPDRRGQGLMAAVLDIELEWFRARRTSAAVTLSWRRAAQSSFNGLQHAGFVTLGTQMNYWPGYEPATLMRWQRDQLALEHDSNHHRQATRHLISA